LLLAPHSFEEDAGRHSYTFAKRFSFDIEQLKAKLEQKKQGPTWSINSRESTPEILYEPHPDSELDYWKASR
jgi:hypothetical protein